MIDIVFESDAEEEFRAVQDEINNLQPFWADAIRNQVVPEYMRVFETAGYGTWSPTQSPNPILRRTGRLYRSYTDVGSPDNISQVNDRGMEYGTRLSYAQYVERHRPVSDLVFRNESFQLRIRESLDQYLQERIDAVSST